MDRADVTVCMPIYNGSRYLAKSIGSIVSQTFPGHLEVLLIDDCSTDGSLDLAQSFLNDGCVRCTMIRNQSNLGLVENWNNCLKHAQGRYVMFLFQDDWLQPDCIEKMYGLALEHDTPLVICDRSYKFEGEITHASIEFFEKSLLRLSHFATNARVFSAEEIALIAYENFLGKNFIGEPVVGLMRRDLIADIGSFDTTLRQICDFDYWLRACTSTSFVYSPERLVNFRIHAQSTSSKNSHTAVSLIDRIILGHRMVCDEKYASFRAIVPGGTNAIRDAFRLKLHHYLSTRNYYEVRRMLPTDVQQGDFNDLNPGPLKACGYQMSRIVKSVASRLGLRRVRR